MTPHLNILLYLPLIYQLVFIEGYPEHGVSVSLTDDQANFTYTKMKKIGGWKHEGTAQYLIGLEFDGTTITVKKSGIYYISYQFLLKDPSGSTQLGAVVNNDIFNNMAIYSDTFVEQGTDLSAAGFLKLKSEDQVNIYLRSNNKGDKFRICKGTSLSFRFHNYAPSSPGFLFSLSKAIKLTTNKKKTKLGGWITKEYGQFYSSSAFRQGQYYFQIPANGIYIISANILIINFPNNKGIIYINLYSNENLLTRVFKYMLPGKTHTINLHETFYLTAESHLFLEIETSGNRTNVLDTSTWSVVLIKEKSEIYNGFHYELNNDIDINYANNHKISPWILENGTGNFASVDLLDKKTFNTEKTSFFYVSTNLKFAISLNHTLSEGKFFNVTFAGPSNMKYLEKSFKSHLQKPLDANGMSVQTYSISLAGVFQLSKSLPLSISLSAPYSESLVILNESTFSIIQVAESYPGVYTHIKGVNNKYTKQDTSPTNWGNTGVGVYDLPRSFNATTGHYTATRPGVYLVAANLVIEDLESQVSLLISKNNERVIDNGIYILEKNPALKSTLNVGGFFELKTSDRVSLSLKAKDDEDWNIKTTGLSVVYFGIRPTYFQSKLKENVVRSTKAKKYILANWNDGKNMLLSESTYKIKITGVYFVIANIIFKDTTPNLSGSYFKIYVAKNGVIIPGLVSIRQHQQETNTKSVINDFTLFLSGSFYAKVGDHINIYVDTGLNLNYIIAQESLWGLSFVSSIEDVSGTYTTLENSKSFISANPWQSFGDFKFRNLLDSGLFRSEKLNLAEKKSVKVKSQGVYLISANIELSYPHQNGQLFKVAIVINGNEGENNGLLIWQKSNWKTFSVHIIGGLLLNLDDEITLKLTLGSTVNVVSVNKDLGFSVIAIPEAKQPTTFAVILKSDVLIPHSFNGTDIAGWEFTGSLSSSNFDKESGVITVENDGFYMLTSALNFENVNKLIEGVEVYIMLNDGILKNFTVDLRKKNASINIDEIMELSYNDQLNLKVKVLYNVTKVNELANVFLRYNQSGIITSGSNPTNPYDSLTVTVKKDGSSLSLIYMPNFEPIPGFVADFIQDHKVTATGDLQELNTGWVVTDNPLVNGNRYFVEKPGVYFLMFKILIKNITGTVELSFTIDKLIICSCIYKCINTCEVLFQAICMAKINQSENIKISIKTTKPNVIVSKDSTRLINFMNTNPKGFAVSIREDISKESAEDEESDWFRLGDWIYSKNEYGLFNDTVITYRDLILLKSSGVYQFSTNVQIRMIRNKTENVMVSCKNDTNVTTCTTVTVPILISYTKVELCIFIGGKCDPSLYKRMDISSNKEIFTISISGTKEMLKWDHLTLQLKFEDYLIDFEVLKGTTWSGIVTEEAPFSLVSDPGPIMMSKTLLPVNYSTPVMGVEKEWTCHAYGDGKITYRWYKDNQLYLVQNTSIGVLTLGGYINDTGIYYCEAEISSIVFLSSEIRIDIFDINECKLGLDDCSTYAECINTPGSFTCKCNVGYNGNGKTCENINECSSKSACVSNSVCKDLVGSYECTCRDGFLGSKAKIDPCNDINECASPSLNDCDRSHGICVNTPGSYHCLCENGWTGNGKNCTDYDECTTNNFTCPAHSTCNNLNGTYNCSCDQGYQQDVTNNITSCIDIDECDVTGNATFDILGKCVFNTVCVNTDGGYDCKCKKGFTGVGTKSCTDNDECVEQKCNAQANCVNTVGGFTCQCRVGWKGDGYRCSDVNECDADTSLCLNGTCVNENGDYSCKCDPGFRTNGAKECQEDNGKAVSSEQTDPCKVDASSFKCVCSDPEKRKNNILCNGLFVALIILVLVAVVVMIFVVKYMKSRKQMKIRPARVHKDKYIEMENESEL